MLSVYSRHKEKCAQADDRVSRKCRCPLWATGALEGEPYRKSLKTRNWERAEQLIRQIEEGTKPAETKLVPELAETIQKFMLDARAWPETDPGHAQEVPRRPRPTPKLRGHEARSLPRRPDRRLHAHVQGGVEGWLHQHREEARTPPRIFPLLRLVRLDGVEPGAVGLRAGRQDAAHPSLYRI